MSAQADQPEGVTPRRGWERILSPMERLSEVLFGLIMVLSITGTLSVVGDDDVHKMLIGAIGCNTAWGIVDAVMYLMATLIERYRSLALLTALRSEPDPQHGQEMIVTRLPPFLARLIRVPELEHLRLQLVAMPEAPPAGLTGRDLLGAFAIFLLVFLSTFPVVLPFLLPVEPRLALRVSNGVAIVLLFVVGLRVGKYVCNRPLLMGVSMVAIGVALVGITIALGG